MLTIGMKIVEIFVVDIKALSYHRSARHNVASLGAKLSCQDQCSFWCDIEHFELDLDNK